MVRLFLSVAALSATLAFPVLAAEVNVGGAVDSTVSGAANAAGAGAGANTDASANAAVAANTSGDASATAYVAGSLTVDNIDANSPFGNLVVDQNSTPKQINAGLTDENRIELHDRCSLILQKQEQFTTAVPAFCTTYLAWMKQNPTVQ